MRQRLPELLLCMLIIAGIGLWVLFPPAGRPQDIDLQVVVKPMEPWQGNVQRVAATVRWHWLHQPPIRMGDWYDQIGFVYDQARWQPVWTGTSVGAETVLARYGEPDLIHLLVGSAQDGEMTLQFINQGPAQPAYQTPVMPLRVQFIHSQDDSGWVRSLENQWPIASGQSQVWRGSYDFEHRGR